MVRGSMWRRRRASRAGRDRAPTVPQAAAGFCENDVDVPPATKPAGQSGEVLAELMSEPARAAVAAERRKALEARVPQGSTCRGAFRRRAGPA